jgi:DNA-directed RNA polymerase sigma subunit (sigma70/sigma32)
MVIRKRFGFDGPPVTPDKIAEPGVNAERVRHVERRATNRLRAALRVSRPKGS